MSRNFDLLEQMEQSRTRSLDGVGSTTGEPWRERAEQTGRAYSSQPNADGALRLVQSIFLLQTEKAPRVVVFAGVDHGSGCSRIVASVAENLAASGRGAVCLVEANFRSPGLPALLGMTNHFGLTDALLKAGEIRSFLRPVGQHGAPAKEAEPESRAGVWLLSSGALAADSPKLLASERLRERFAELRQQFDFVLVDAPPLMRYPDAISLGQLSDGLVLILEAEATRREAAQVSMDNLRSANIPVLAAVLNKRTYPIPEAIYKRL